MTAAGRFPRSVDVSPRVDEVASAGSTNADLVGHVTADPDAWPHLSVLLTTDQRSGRGRLDRVWTAPPGTALAISTVLRVGDVPPAARGWIPLLAGTAMTRAVAAQVGAEAVRMKWPNDVLVDGAKLCGILAEVVAGVPDTVVVGVGVNTRMSADELPVPTATSFAVLGAECDADALIADYLTGIARLVVGLVSSEGDAAASGLLGEVESLCGTLGRDVAVSLPDGSTLRGGARAIDRDGRLVVATSTGDVAVSAGDVVHVR